MSYDASSVDLGACPSPLASRYLPYGVVQIAGIIDQVEADMLVGAGVDMLGFPLRLPVNAVDLSEKVATVIANTCAGKVPSCLITYLDQASALRDFVQEMNMPILQVHGRITVNELARLRGMLPDLVIIKSLVVRDGNDDSLQQTLRKATPYVDAFITDTFDPTTGASGATGKCHDWQISARLVQLSERPVILAGGLHPDNVADAIQMV